jgi:hypothetical protein
MDADWSGTNCKVMCTLEPLLFLGHPRIDLPYCLPNTLVLTAGEAFELPDLNKIGISVEFEFQMNIFSISIPHILHGLYLH